MEAIIPATLVQAMDAAQSTWTVGKTFRFRCILFGGIGIAGMIASIALLLVR